MIVLGIDPDTKAVTLCLYDGEDHFFYRAQAKGRRAEERLEPLHWELWRLMNDLCLKINFRDNCWTYLERPMGGPNVGSLLVQAQAIGVVRAVLFQLRIPHSMVDPNVWKKGILGNGNATKEQVKRWSLSQGVEDGLKQDFYDAYVIARWGHANAE